MLALAVQGGQHLHRRQPPGLEHAVEHRQRLPGLTPIDGLGHCVSGHTARLAEIGGDVLRGEGRSLAVRRAECTEEAFHPPQVLTDVVGKQIRRLAVQLDRGGAQVLVQPALPVAGLGGRDVDHRTAGRDSLDEWRRDGPAPGHEHQHGGGERVLHDLDEPRGIGREQTPRIAHDDDAPVDEERGCEAGVHHRADVQLVPGGATDLLDDQGVVTVAHQVGEEGAHLLGHQGRVVAAYEVDGHRRKGSHGASLIGRR
jgi:hypothetical protein